MGHNLNQTKYPRMPGEEITSSISKGWLIHSTLAKAKEALSEACCSTLAMSTYNSPQL